MLRKLFGLSPPARLPRPVRMVTRRPAAPVDVAPPRRKPVLEALESRLLLSADPLGVLDAYGVLALQFGEGNDRALVERVGESAAGGEIVAVTLGSVTQHYGDAFFGIVRLLVDMGAGDDWLRIVGVSVGTEIIGGLGTDTLEWQGADATWSITAPDTGVVETASFGSFEHLVGSDDYRDTFVFAAGAAVSGGIEGGAGGLDAIVIQGGEYQNVTYIASGPASGTIAMDGREIAFDGIEPVTLAATAASLTLNATSGDDDVRLREDEASGRTLFESVTGTLAEFAFATPTESLTIDLGSGDDRITIGTLDRRFSAALDVRGGDGRDHIGFYGSVATHGQDLSAAAEAIEVGPGAELRTDLGADGAVGDLVLAAAAASTDARGAADASVTVGDGTLIGRNVAISATATLAVDAAFVDADSTATVAISGGSEVAAGGALTIEARSFVWVTTDAAQPDATVNSTAAARIGGAATLAAAGDLAIDVVNIVDITAVGAPAAVAAIALETIVMVDAGALLAGHEVSLRAASDAHLALAGVVTILESESVTWADPVGEAAIDLGRRANLVVAEGNARAVAGAPGGEAPRLDAGRDPGRPMDSGGDATAAGNDEGLADDPRRAAAGRPDAGELAADLHDAGPGERFEGAIAGESAAVGTPGLWPGLQSAELQSEEARNAEVAMAVRMLAAAGSIALAPAAESDVDPEGRRRRGAASEEDGDDGDTGLGASLALSVVKDSALAELARNVTGSGAVALSAGGTPFVRGRARGAPGSENEPGGALEIRDAEAAGTVILAAVDASTGPEVLHFIGAGELVLATAARHDLVAEASGGAEPGTAVTAATPIDVASADAAAEPGAETFTLAALADAAAARGADHDEAPGSDGLALSTDLPPLAFEYLVGEADRERAEAAIRSGDDAHALARADAIEVSGLLDTAVPAPGAIAARVDDPVGDSRQVVMAYLGALAAPIAASAGLPPSARGVPARGGRGRTIVPGATGFASRAEFGAHRDAFRSGGNWAEKFVNELGLAAEEQNPNAKIKIKL